jgi:hypothetical protein
MKFGLARIALEHLVYVTKLILYLPTQAPGRGFILDLDLSTV